MVLKFDIPSLRKHYEHACASTSHKSTFGESENNIKPKPALWLVKDEGIYIMSNGTGENRPDVCYAQGFDPTQRDRMDVWDDARDAVGGDDFCDLIDHDTCESLLGVANGHELHIRLTRDTLDFGVTTRKPH